MRVRSTCTKSAFIGRGGLCIGRGGKPQYSRYRAHESAQRLTELLSNSEMATSTLPLASKSIPHQALTNGDAEHGHVHVAKPKKTKRLSWTLGRKKGKDEAYVADRSGKSLCLILCVRASIVAGRLRYAS